MPKDLWQRERDKDHGRKALGELAAYGCLVSYTKIENDPTRKRRRKKTKTKRKKLSPSRPARIRIGSSVVWGGVKFRVVEMNEEWLGIARKAKGSVEKWILKSEL